MMELLEAAGCWLGPKDALFGTGPDNPKGFRENSELVAINDAVLASLAARWFDVLSIVDGALVDVDRQEFFRRARRVLSRIRSDGAWAIKDPRLVPLFPLWRDVLDEPTVLLMLRRPVEVAVSLNRRNNLALETGAALWEAYMVMALQSSKGLRRRLVRHHNLVTDPEKGMVGLIKSLEDSYLEIPTAGVIGSIVEPSLHRATTSASLEKSILTEYQRELFDAIDDCSSLDELPSFELSPQARVVLEEFGSAHRPRTPMTSRPIGARAGRRRVAVVVQGCRLPQFEQSISAIRETWAAESHEDVDIFFAYGNACEDHQLTDLQKIVGRPLPTVPEGEARRYGNVLVVGCSDLIGHRSDALLRKRLLSLEYLLQRQDHDAFLLVGASSYVDQAVLVEHAQEMPLELVLQGPVLIAEDTGRPVVSGSAMLISRDFAHRLVDDAGSVLAASGYRYADDVSISDWAAAHVSNTSPEVQVARLSAGRSATTDNTFAQPPVNLLDFRDVDTDQHVPVEKSYHYRFAADEHEAMRTFHKRFFANDDQLASVATSSEPEKMRLEIDLDTSGIEPLDDYEMWVFVVMGADERELVRQDIYDPEVLGGESKRVVVEAEFDTTPAKYLLWPKSASQGFGDRRIHNLD